MKDYSDLLTLEENILNGNFKVKKRLFNGAGQMVDLPTSELPDQTGVIKHKEAFAISTLLYHLKNIIPYDYFDKYELFDTLVKDLPPENACVEIIGRAKIAYLARIPPHLRLK